MSISNKILNDKFWNILATIESLEQDVSFEELTCHSEEVVEDSDILEVVSFLRKFNYPISTTKKDGRSWLCFDDEKPRMVLDLSLGEWIALQSHFPLLDAYKGKAIYNSLAVGLNRVESSNPDKDLYRVLEEESHLKLKVCDMDTDREAVLRAIDKAGLYSDLLLIGCGGSELSEVFVHKVVFLDGVLSLIGEDTKDRCLLCIDFDEIESVKIIDNSNYRPNFAGVEIDDFVLAIRSITGNEERLVLRISSPEKVNLKPEFHFLGNPYVTTNTDGEFIWAASVEVSDELFGWLASIEEESEILDPYELRKEFENYKQMQLAVVPNKKAS